MVVFHALTLKLPIQISLSVVPKLTVLLSSHEKCPNFGKTSTPQGLFNCLYSVANCQLLRTLVNSQEILLGKFCTIIQSLSSSGHTYLNNRKRYRNRHYKLCN